MTHNFNVTKQEDIAIYEAATRFKNVITDHEFDMLGLIMDITACHTGPCKLDLEALADAPVFDLVHDIGGIYKNFNRETGKLDNHFLPRTAFEQ